MGVVHFKTQKTREKTERKTRSTSTFSPKKKKREGSRPNPKSIMREEDSNWFSKWEEELPAQDNLVPLSQTLITPDLALAFDIRPPNPSNSIPTLTQSTPPPPSQPLSSDFDSGELGSSNPGEEPARTLKRPRLVWTPQLHKRFVDAVAHLGIKNAVPKTIMQLMSVDGLTRENVASHLQKYRLYLKRMQGIGGGGASAPGDAATDRLFASQPVPHHFLHPGGRGTPEHYMPFVPVAAALQHHHNQQMAAAAAVEAQRQFHQRQVGQVGQFGSPPGGGYDHAFLSRQAQPLQPVHRMAVPVPVRPGNYVEDLESPIGGGGGGRKVLTLFPTGED